MSSSQVEVKCVHCGSVLRIDVSEIRTPYYCWKCK
jgi:formamidopyrimidine-DNA glycosylase